MFAIIRTRWQTRPLSPRAKRRSSADPGSLRKKYAGIHHPPPTCFVGSSTLPHLGINGSRYKTARRTWTGHIEERLHLVGQPMGRDKVPDDHLAAGQPDDEVRISPA